MRIKFWPENSKRTDRLEDLGLYERIVFTQIEYDYMYWILLAQIRVERRAVMSTNMKFRIL